MTILAFDTCFNACSVALGHQDGNGQQLVSWERQLMRQGHAEALVPMIERVGAMAGVAIGEITRIAVTHGPGTFTGVRTGLAAARAMSIALDVPAIGFSSLRAIGMAAGREVIAAADAGRGRLFVQTIGAYGDELTSPQLLGVREVVALVTERQLPVVGNGAAVLSAAGCHFDALTVEDNPDVRLLLDLARTAPLPTTSPRPLYLREPDAKPQDGKAIARAP
jgi:tRNA threonylcarbamoyl adenosine modification protein YeaZ